MWEDIATIIFSNKCFLYFCDPNVNLYCEHVIVIVTQARE